MHFLHGFSESGAPAGKNYLVRDAAARPTQRDQFHQQRLVQNATAYDPRMRFAAAALVHTLERAGLRAPDAIHQAYARIYSALQAQALAYIDTFRIMAIAALCLLLAVLLLRRLGPSRGRRPLIRPPCRTGACTILGVLVGPPGV